MQTCNYTRPTKHGVWECEQPDCDGMNHYAKFYPYMKPRKRDDLGLFIYSGVLGVVAGLLLGNYFGVFLWN